MRRSVVPLSGLMALAAAGSSADDKPAPASSPSKLEAFVIPSATAKPADSDAPMAEGWPRATGPGRIEVKDYPAYRSAVARGKGAGLGADNVLFFPLFKHITSNDIAMTTPVVSSYSAELLKEPKATGDVAMEFVYRSATTGKVGPGIGAVKVEDHPAATYVCLGVQGDLDPDRMRKAVAALRDWLEGHKSEWVEQGTPRRLGYHGPMTRRDERLWEVQLPVKRVAKPEP